jgi:hypothetical protein
LLPTDFTKRRELKGVSPTRNLIRNVTIWHCGPTPQVSRDVVWLGKCRQPYWRHRSGIRLFQAMARAPPAAACVRLRLPQLQQPPCIYDPELVQRLMTGSVVQHLLLNARSCESPMPRGDGEQTGDARQSCPARSRPGTMSLLTDRYLTLQQIQWSASDDERTHQTASSWSCFWRIRLVLRQLYSLSHHD